MTLHDLLQGVTAEPVAAVPIRGIARHSKQVREGDLFIAIPGADSDGHAFIDEAIERGAAAILAEHLPKRSIGQGRSLKSCPCVVVRDTRQALAVIAARFYGHPARKLKLVGVTGTNGKTTTAYLLKNMLESAGFATGMLGTIVYQIGSREVPSTNTTPGPLELQRFFAQMVGEGLPWCVMEASSHALAQGRIDGLEFNAAIFGNLGSDHLDYHKTRQAYAAAKRRIFEYLKSDGVAVINADDEYGRTLTQTISHPHIVTYGMDHPAKVMVTEAECTWAGIRLTLDSPFGSVQIRTPLLGRHNILNITAAASALLALGVNPAHVGQGLSHLQHVPGRLERVPNEAGVNVLIDYAHTAEALRLTLLSLREMTQGRLIVTFGCGGNRDQQKRAAMGRVASLLADHVILTSDNPRSEDPLEIIQHIRSGFANDFQRFQIVPDRERAIYAALGLARAEDTILIAGKGHETYQVFHNTSIPFVDRDVVERWASSRHSLVMS